MPVILEAENLVKKYGENVAVKGISFTMEEGEVFGLLGPNGAGKSTTISMLTCLFPPTEGRIRIYGHDVVKEANQVKRLIGIVPQDLALYPTLNARDQPDLLRPDVRVGRRRSQAARRDGAAIRRR